MNKTQYMTYLASREWALLKEAVKNRANGICERCLRNEIAATHHLTYERIGSEKTEDLQGLCEECHSFVSGRSENDPKETSKQLFLCIKKDMIEALGHLRISCTQMSQFPLLHKKTDKLFEAVAVIRDFNRHVLGIPCLSNIPESPEEAHNVQNDRDEDLG